ncbi:unnamed protein product [Paramecium sonneborni]|uniref:Transmembrane protein n=1 Tax=Paramecium sonneborni TaxID=65129 RepID=A0A8S1R3S3_9CILI|nr:unnamed protein product [Paramecium sonneborni]
MNKILNTIDKIDVFGVPINLLTNEKSSIFQSKVGGLLTLIAGALSISYFLYVFVFWVSNLIPPNISFKQETIGYAQFHIQSAMIELMLTDFSGDADPFRKENNIITPHLYTVIDTTIIDKPIPLFSTQEKPYIISFENVTLVLNHQIDPDQNHQEMKQYLIVLESCSNTTLQDNGYCADQKTIDDYLQKFHGFLFLSIKLNQLNHVTRELEEFNKQYYQAFDMFKPQYSQVMLKQQETVIDDGLLFNNYQNYQFLNNYELINQQVDTLFSSNVVSQMSKQQYNFTNYACYLFRLDSIQVKELVTMPKLGQFLAQVGSIVQLIFLLQHIALYYNNKLLENQLLHEIITMYYPELKNIKLTIFNKLEFKESVDNNIKCINLDFKSKYKILVDKAKEKCRFNNILYEISRIQFIIQQQFGDQVLQQSHLLGGKLENNYYELQNCKETKRLAIKPENSIDLGNGYPLLDPLEILSKQPWIA